MDPGRSITGFALLGVGGLLRAQNTCTRVNREHPFISVFPHPVLILRRLERRPTGARASIEVLLKFAVLCFCLGERLFFCPTYTRTHTWKDSDAEIPHDAPLTRPPPAETGYITHEPRGLALRSERLGPLHPPHNLPHISLVGAVPGGDGLSRRRGFGRRLGPLAYHAHERLSVTLASSSTLPAFSRPTEALAVQVAPFSNFSSTSSTSSSLESGRKVASRSRPLSSSRW